eukprot:6455592-Pyramimonas_sp.AAC.1
MAIARVTATIPSMLLGSPRCAWWMERSLPPVMAALGPWGPKSRGPLSTSPQWRQAGSRLTLTRFTQIIKRVVQLHGEAGHPRRNQWSGRKVLAGGGHFDLGPELQKVQAHQNTELPPPTVTNSV